MSGILKKEIRNNVVQLNRAGDSRRSDLTDRINQIFIGLNHKLRITQWNHKAEQVSGISRAKAVGMPLNKALPPLLGTGLLGYVRQARHTERPVEFRQKISALKNGFIAQLHFEVVIFLDEGGLSILATDVTEAYFYRQRQSQMELMFQDLLNNNPNPCCYGQWPNYTVWCNHAFNKTFGPVNSIAVIAKLMGIDSQIELLEKIKSLNNDECYQITQTNDVFFKSIAYDTTLKKHHADYWSVSFKTKPAPIKQLNLTIEKTESLAKSQGQHFKDLVNKLAETQNELRNERLHRLQQEAKIRSYDLNYKLINQNNLDAVIRHTLLGNVIFASNAVEHFIGQSALQLTGRSWFDFVHPLDRKRVRDHFLNFASDQTSAEITFRMEIPGQSIIWVECLSKKPAINFPEFLSVLRNITHRRQSELSRAQMYQKYQLLIKALGDVVYEQNYFENYFKWDGAVKEMLGYTPGQLGQGTSGYLMLVHPNDLNAMRNAYDMAWHNKTNFSLKYRVKTANGNYIWVQDRSRLLIDKETGSIKSILGVLENITEQIESQNEIKKLNHNLRKRAAELENAYAELETFSYSVSHDLRAPLRSISGFSENLLEVTAHSTNSFEYDLLQRINNAAERMGHIIEGLLQLSKYTNKTVKKRKLDISANATEIVQRLQKHDPQRQVTFNIEPDLTAIGDPSMIFILLQNLLGNAYKFTSKKTNAIISIKKHSEFGTKVVFEISDNGCGFDPKLADKIFKPFMRLHSQKEFSGTGIGLATAKRILQRHQGSIWVKTKPGHGTSFFVKLSNHKI